MSICYIVEPLTPQGNKPGSKIKAPRQPAGASSPSSYCRLCPARGRMLAQMPLPLDLLQNLLDPFNYGAIEACCSLDRRREGSPLAPHPAGWRIDPKLLPVAMSPC
ncbi:hypothetical protein SUGI_0579990 [Cryptomeria japonica]|nr:hypothetical protein SUGI_0579990 [Cryptomeria japonica]